MRELCYKARELLIEEGNVVGVDAPVTVRSICGGAKQSLTSMVFLRRYAVTYTASFTT